MQEYMQPIAVILEDMGGYYASTLQWSVASFTFCRYKFMTLSDAQNWANREYHGVPTR